MIAGRGRRRDDHGAAAVEFALVVIPLILIIAGIVNFGVVFAQQIALDNAARQAARGGAVDGRDAAWTQSHAQATIDGTLIAKSQTSGVVITIASSKGTNSCEDSDFGDSITVTATTTSKFLFPWPVPGVPGSVNLTGTGEFQCEFS